MTRVLREPLIPIRRACGLGGLFGRGLFPMRSERLDEIVAELPRLPPAQLGNALDLLACRWILSGDGLHPVARAEHAGVEVETRRCGVAGRLQCIDPRIEI